MMTVQELYARIGGNYEHALKILKMDKLIDRYIRKLRASGVIERLEAASAAGDPAMLFDSVHAMKGVCANLGLDTLAEAAGILADEYRPGCPRRMSDEEAAQKLRELSELYRRTEEGIAAYENGQA